MYIENIKGQLIFSYNAFIWRCIGSKIASNARMHLSKSQNNKITKIAFTAYFMASYIMKYITVHHLIFYSNLCTYVYDSSWPTIWFRVEIWIDIRSKQGIKRKLYMSYQTLIFCHTNIKHVRGEIAIEIKYTANFPREFIGITCCIISEKPYTCETQTILHRQGITHGYC